MNEDSSTTNILFLIMIAVQIAVFIGTGTLAWDWIKPKSFMGAIGFMVLWSILETAAFYAIGFVFMLAAQLNEGQR